MSRAASTLPFVAALTAKLVPEHTGPVLVSIRPVLLLVATDPVVAESMRSQLSQKFEVRSVRVDQAMAAAEQTPFDVLLVDVRGFPDANSVVNHLRQRQPQAAIVAIGSVDRPQTAIDTLEHGATEFVLRPFGHADELAIRIEAALTRRRAGEDSETLSASYSPARASLIRNFDLKYLHGLMRATRGNISESSRRSGIDRANLRRMLRHYVISPSEFGAVRSETRPLTPS